MDRYTWTHCQAGTASLRLHRYRPTASIGAHDDLGHAARGDYCVRQQIAVVHRLTGGEAVYLDPGTICWSLVFRRHRRWRKETLGRLMAFLTSAVVDTLRSFSADAAFREPNEVECSGRRIGAAFIAQEEGAVLYQGIMLERLDIERMLKVVRTPLEKLSQEGLQNARERFMTLDDCRPSLSYVLLRRALCNRFARILGVRLRPAPTRPRHVRAGLRMTEKSDSELGSTAFLPTSGGGLIRTSLKINGAGIVTRATLSANIQCSPRTLLTRITERLIGLPAAQAGDQVWTILESIRPDLIGARPEDLSYVVRLAADRPGQANALCLSSMQANTLMVHAPTRTETAQSILRNATAMLIPYCAKPVWCKWRHRDGCSECGLCTVGDAYRIGREQGMRVVTVTNYEHLCQTLQALRHEGVAAYIGMCCAHFYQKRHYAFSTAGLPALLIDISGANCYDLGQQDEAYAGRFHAQAIIDVTVLDRTMKEGGRTRASGLVPIGQGQQQASQEKVDP